MQHGSFPALRLRRLRRTPWLRALVSEVRLHPSDLIWPVFVQEGTAETSPIPTLPGVERYSVDVLVTEAAKAHALGIPAIALFPATDPAHKTADGREALNPENLVCRAVRAVKQAVPELGIICDVALDPYTTHGHDGVLDAARGGARVDVANDATVEILAKQAVVLAAAGADIVAPSDMMDGRVATIRAALDDVGHGQVAILSYAAKYASAFYGPFRDAVGSAQNLGKADKRTYQMDPANGEEALREVALDVAEGADMVMVKPGMPYLDVVARVAERFNVPVFAYQVSGEYAMLKAAAGLGAFDFMAAMQESLLAFKRAGARGIFTYAAREVAAALET